MCSTVFITALFVIVTTRKQPKHHSTEELIKKMWYIYAVDYHKAEKNKFLKSVDKWMDIDNIILSKVTQIQKYKHNMHSLISGF